LRRESETRRRTRCPGRRRTRYAQVDAIADVTLVSRGRDHLGRGMVGCSGASPAV